MDYYQLKDMIKSVLKSNELDCSGTIVRFLTEIACVESDCGKYLKQIKGPACGIFQIEPNTAKDIIKNYLAYHPVIKEKVMGSFIDQYSLADNLSYNLPFSILMCRAFFLRFKEQIPGSLVHRATYWKKYYNTENGKGMVTDYIERVKKHVK